MSSPNFVQNPHEAIPPPSRSEQWSPPITTERNEAQVALSVVSLERITHTLWKVHSEEKPAPLNPKGAAPRFVTLG